MNSDQQLLDTLIAEITKLPENDFSKTILVPLFKALGFRQVDFHGGPYEGGKDLVLWREDAFGDPELTVVQVKKVQLSAAVSGGRSYPEIVTQLAQAATKPVPTLEMAARVPDKLVFVTPYPIGTREIEQGFEQAQVLRGRGIKVYDGHKIADLLLKKLPKLAEQLVGTEVLIPQQINELLSNAALLGALGYRKELDFKDFYCDLEFGVGRVKATSFLQLKAPLADLPVMIDSSSWDDIRDRLQAAEKLFEKSIVIPPWPTIEGQFHSHQIRFASEENGKTLAEIQASLDRIETSVTVLGRAIGALQVHLDALFPAVADTKVEIKEEEDSLPPDAIATDDHLDAIDDIHKQMKQLLAKQSDSVISTADVRALTGASAPLLTEVRELASSVKGVHALPEIKQLPRIALDEPKQRLSRQRAIQEVEKTKRAAQEIRAELRRLPNVIAKRIDKPTYNFTVDARGLSHELGERQAWLKHGLTQLKGSDRPSVLELRQFFGRCQEMLRVADALLGADFLRGSLSPTALASSDVADASRVNTISLHDVFDTGLDVALLGEAGAGKSTTLQMYSRRIGADRVGDVFSLFLPLARLLSANSEALILGEKDPLKGLEWGLLDYLRERGHPLSDLALERLLRSKRRCVLIFDGIDEVVRAAPWVMKAINGFRVKHAGVQLIVSSRSVGQHLEAGPYLWLTLLPFTDVQRMQFISGWFRNDEPRARSLLEHLEQHPSLGDVVRSPLSATILCVLAENKVPLPTSEISLYRKRLELLLGHYDVHKQLQNRLDSTYELLEAVARKLAYRLHRSGVKAAPKQQLLEWSRSSLSAVYSVESIDCAMDELVNPCNMLVGFDNNEIGFGHLRYQEHLAAEELVRNRGLDLNRLLSSSWWRPVLVFFSQMTDDFESVLEGQLLTAGHIGSSYETLQAMLVVRPAKEQAALNALLNRHHNLDDLYPDSDREGTLSSLPGSRFVSEGFYAGSEDED